MESGKIRKYTYVTTINFQTNISLKYAVIKNYFMPGPMCVADIA